MKSVKDNHKRRSENRTTQKKGTPTRRECEIGNHHETDREKLSTMERLGGDPPQQRENHGFFLCWWWWLFLLSSSLVLRWLFSSPSLVWSWWRLLSSLFLWRRLSKPCLSLSLSLLVVAASPFSVYCGGGSHSLHFKRLGEEPLKKSGT